MEMIQQIFSYILGLGAAIFVPIIMIVCGLLVKMKIKDAISAAITLGVAFMAMSLIIGYMQDAIRPAALAMSAVTGQNFSTIDGGWTTMATISWSWPYAFMIFPLQIGINILMLVTKKTNTFNADLWNVWGKIFTAVCVIAITNSVPLAFVVASVQIVLELKSGDMHQKRIENLTGIPGITCTHRTLFLGSIYYPIDCLLRKIPFLNKPFNAQTLKEKIGIFAENHVLGFVLGVLFGLIAKFNMANTLTLGVKAATAMTLFPMATKLFMQALAPISEAVSDYMQTRFSNRELFVGLDWPFMGGASELWIVVIISIPVLLMYAMFLPGNNLLPFAGIINISLVLPAYIVTKGNIPRMLILCLIGAPIFLYVGTLIAPFMTNLAIQTGAVEIAAGELISNSSINAPVFTYWVTFIWNVAKGDFFPLVVAIVWSIGFFFYKKSLTIEIPKTMEA